MAEDVEPTIETIEAAVGHGDFAITGDDAARVLYLLGGAVGLAHRHRAERDELRAVVQRIRHWLAFVEADLGGTLGAPAQTRDDPEPEVQHVDTCEHPLHPCSCPRDHLLAEGRRIREMCLFAEDEFRRENERAVAVKIERDELRSALDTILDGLVGLDSDDAYVAITTEHLNVVRAALRKGAT